LLNSFKDEAIVHNLKPKLESIYGLQQDVIRKRSVSKKKRKLEKQIKKEKEEDQANKKRII
jgi:hypothetical protein